MKFYLLLSLFLVTTSIYEKQYVDIDGNNVSMSSYQGKKILLVNIATGNSRISQLTGLQQLHRQYGDSVAIIVFPSNSFGREPRTDSEIKTLCRSNYGVTFQIAAKSDVTGANAQSIYHWLTNINENGVMNDPIRGDFEKFLIDRNGNLIGIFSPRMEPTDSAIIEALIH